MHKYIIYTHIMIHKYLSLYIYIYIREFSFKQWSYTYVRF